MVQQTKGRNDVGDICEDKHSKIQNNLSDEKKTMVVHFSMSYFHSWFIDLKCVFTQYSPAD